MGQEQWESPLKMEPLDSGRTWRTLEAFTYETDEKEHITVPAGTLTDFASVPRILWNILPPMGRYLRAAVLHDYLYGLHRLGDESRLRSFVDRLFFQAMLDCKVHPLVAHIMWMGVRLGGWWAWMPGIDRVMWRDDAKKKAVLTIIILVALFAVWWFLPCSGCPQRPLSVDVK